MPLDKGFNRLSWAVPYAVGVFGAAAAGVRWPPAVAGGREPSRRRCGVGT